VAPSKPGGVWLVQPGGVWLRPKRVTCGSVQPGGVWLRPKRVTCGAVEAGAVWRHDARVGWRYAVGVPPEIRILRAEDRAEHLRMRCALWPEADRAELDAELDGWLEREDQVTFVAERAGGGLAGFVEAGIRAFANGVDESPCAFVEGWFVDEDKRRTGVGRALIEAVEAWATSRGFTELGSDTETTNLLSQHAHAALGFEERERTVAFRKKL
jgi:aminoglycoside 6'-N-acetyltransferase I